MALLFMVSIYFYRSFTVKTKVGKSRKIIVNLIYLQRQNDVGLCEQPITVTHQCV